MLGDGIAILILGGSGQTGRALTEQPWPEGVRLYSPTRRELDVTREAAIVQALSARRWDCIINCAAYTAVDAAEKDADTAWAVNATAPAVLARITAQLDMPLIHLSTDYVFDGKSNSPYRPSDLPRPLNVYGRSKAAGEDAVRRLNRKHIILRTSWLVSPYGKNFVKTMLASADRRQSVKVVDDQFGRPTSASDLATAINTITMRVISSAAPFGTYHFANSGRTSWHDFAAAIMSGARERGAPAVSVEPIPSSCYRTAAVRPSNSELCTEDLERDFGIVPRHWQTALEDILDTLRQGR